MSAISIRAFLGISPAVNPRLLPDGMAVTAENTDLTDGTLRPWLGTSVVHTPTKAGTKLTIYRYGQDLVSETQYWFTWTTDVDVVKAPIDNDTAERTVYTGDGAPKQTDNSLALSGGGTNYPNNSYRLGLPAPDISGSGFAVSGTPTNVEDAAQSVAYVMTYVNSWGEESAPSGPSAVLTFQPGQTVNITSLPGAPTGSYNVTAKRLYRSSTGNAGSAYQFLAEIGVGTGSYNDTKKQEELGELISTWDYEQLPDGAKGLCMMAGNIGAAFKDNTVYLSEPGLLYAWPAKYYLSTDAPIVGIAPFGQSLFVGTKANPFVVFAVDPATATATKLDSNQACASKRSVVPMMGGVIYASPDGLYLVTGGGMQSMSDKVFTRAQWQAYKPESFHSYEMDGRYIAFFNTGARQGALVFDFNATRVYELTLTCSAAYNDPIKDALYMAVGTDIAKLTAGAALQMKWRSKVYRAPTDIDMGYGKVEAESYPLTFRLYRGNTLHHVQNVTTKKPFRIPRFRDTEFSVEVEGTAAISAVVVAANGRGIESG